MSSSTRRLRRALTALLVGVVLTQAGCTTDSDGGATAPAGDRGAPGAAAGSDPARPSPSQRLGLRTGWGPSRAQLDRATRDVRHLSLDELAGQVVVARWPAGTEAPVRYVDRLHLGGVVAFDDNIRSTARLRAALTRLQRRSGHGRPLFLGVDQEGGTVTRVTDGVTPLPSFMTSGAAHDPALTRRAWAGIGSELGRLGFTVDLAPDADVTSGTSDAVIRSRSASGDPAQAARQSTAAALGLASSGVLPVVKHFPGHGSLTTDSHLGLPVQRAGLRSLLRTDLVPFRSAIAAGLPAVMVGHIDVRAVDPGTPASVSRKVISGLLRGRLGFHGLVVSDALDMAGVAGVRGVPSVAFLRAGGDVVLMPPDAEVAHDAIVRAVRQGHLGRRRLEQAAARMIAALRWGRAQEQGSGAGNGADAARTPVRSLTRAAVTLVAGRCRGVQVSGAVVPFGDAGAVARFRVAARRAGLRLGTVEEVRAPRPRATGDRRRDRRRLARWRATPPRVVVHGTPVHLVAVDGVVPGPQPDRGVVVTTDVPYALGSTDARVRVAAYGDTPAAMEAVVDVLTGDLRAHGRLPVRVAGVPRSAC
ncbi:glycoside hydrolase family 3 N-terminal domain-containing protein [Nocardioides sp. GY 10127]|uniref:glycoside hydrolase family 3 protein n=1 Tax=Nocardioides sp. GY 10127 TaxID=2569762 RepID=UPI0010A75E42|nr:glycoside hydrolase family 3 N-terminal domain-containing protein [Nocardioides sp. GY 10127]TIC85409.1 glycoside hydrolase family 3 protein [Nocardioides sp. GY 10127]